MCTCFKSKIFFSQQIHYKPQKILYPEEIDYIALVEQSNDYIGYADMLKDLLGCLTVRKRFKNYAMSYEDLGNVQFICIKDKRKSVICKARTRQSKKGKDLMVALQMQQQELKQKQTMHEQPVKIKVMTFLWKLED